MNSLNQKYSATHEIETFNEIINSGGPIPSDYNFLTFLATKYLGSTSQDQNILFENLESIQNSNSLIGHTYKKPYGYAGDFDLIEKIYDGLVTRDIHYSKWDMFYQSTDSAIAVRNRKKYLIKEITKVSKKYESPLFLNVGSGPCTELKEYLDNPFTRNSLFVDCVDLDYKAIEYASNKLEKYSANTNFINKNILRFNTINKYNLIWSAGLFDYLDDRHFVEITKKLYSMLFADGELVIGNFGDKNPSRGLMEVFCEWILIHRSQDKLIELAIQAGVPESKIRVGKESQGINLFLHLKK